MGSQGKGLGGSLFLYKIVTSGRVELLSLDSKREMKYAIQKGKTKEKKYIQRKGNAPLHQPMLKP